ncbi:hypothetical protein F751_5413 [Auxenochlorella protothecoides]|uniref:Uncharacterized protein n=1 Tax=Auxenochlorella protothecoides TaxID=3075 RepID=A0A087SQ44_AUXPR|nr:hypothetical protein F751_5413 [Auxenochlorella protothecoides]KFM27848.1 hypothetical protein F751_5413 [Auxenochlorella protothecoides]
MVSASPDLLATSHEQDLTAVNTNMSFWRCCFRASLTKDGDKEGTNEEEPHDTVRSGSSQPRPGGTARIATARAAVAVPRGPGGCSPAGPSPAMAASHRLQPGSGPSRRSPRKGRELCPLPDPEQGMAQTEALLRAGTLAGLLAAIEMLRRMIRFHPSLVRDCLDDMVRLMQRCLHHADSAVLQAALLAVGDMVTSYGDAMLRYDRPGARIPGSSLLLDIARLTRKELGLAQAADAVLRRYVERLDQQRVVHILERLQNSSPLRYRSKISALLVIATYRLS